MKEHNYYIYITTNPSRTVLYIGMTNDLLRRVQNRGKPDSFTDKYYCHNLIYWEHHHYVLNAIDREKELKGWARAKKNELIAEFNPEWKFLNSEIAA